MAGGRTPRNAVPAISPHCGQGIGARRFGGIKVIGTDAESKWFPHLGHVMSKAFILWGFLFAALLRPSCSDYLWSPEQPLPEI